MLIGGAPVTLAPDGRPASHLLLTKLKIERFSVMLFAPLSSTGVVDFGKVRRSQPGMIICSPAVVRSTLDIVRLFAMPITPGSGQVQQISGMPPRGPRLGL